LELHRRWTEALQDWIVRRVWRPPHSLFDIATKAAARRAAAPFSLLWRTLLMLPCEAVSGGGAAGAPGQIRALPAGRRRE